MVNGEHAGDAILSPDARVSAVFEGPRLVSVPVSESSASFSGEDGNLLINLRSIDIAQEIQDEQGKTHRAPSGRSYAVMWLEIANVAGEELRDFTPYIACQIEDSEGYLVSASKIAPQTALKTIDRFGAGRKTEGRIVFDISKDRVPVKLVWEDFPEGTKVEIGSISGLLKGN